MHEYELSQRYLERLAALVEHCTSPTAGGWTPSDFPLAGLGQAELDGLRMRLGPEGDSRPGWEVVIDTADQVPGAIHPPKKEVEVRDRAAVVLRSTQ